MAEDTLVIRKLMEIKITGRRQQIIQRSIPDNEKDQYVMLSLDDFFNDTQVSKVFLRPGCITDLEDWVNRSLISDKPVNEVGGFVLGTFDKVNDRYEVAFEHFFPIKQVNAQSPVSLVMGADIAVSYGKLMDTYPYMGLVTWFHTHPGHTPYLSSTDLDQTHNVFFVNPFQIALVLDPLTSEFDTGFFTRQSSGVVNNAQDSTQWVSWKNLVNCAQILSSNS